MREHGDGDVPLRALNIRIRSPLAVLLLQPFQLPVAVCLALLAVVFTIWPEALEHSPISFEERGLIHHIWHYTLLVGSLMMLVGMFVGYRRRLRIELAGIVLLAGALGMNLIALITQPEGPNEPSGFGMALRAALIVGFGIRGWIIVYNPVVLLKQVPDGT